MTARVRRAPESGARPTGIVTFLFSDIEGSTARWEREPDAMAVALARHDALVRENVEACGGYVFKTIGDAFCVAFNRTRDAIGAAVATQRALSGESWPAQADIAARMAIHTGSFEERDGDYFGPTVNRVARLLVVGHGGQVLVSGAAADLLQDDLPPQIELRDLGQHVLKDLARPEHIYQLVGPGLPEVFPALRSLDELQNNLPRQLTSFVGRNRELSDIAALIETSPLVTLVGPGGVGKTRCAVQTGADLLDGTGDGVWMVELALVSGPGLVANAIARAFGVREVPNRPVIDSLLAYLRRKRVLLILDNCEHVIGEVRSVTSEILRMCPDVRILATSREALAIAGERVYNLPTLSLPNGKAQLASSEVLGCDAGMLFLDRARAIDPRFAVTDESAPYIAEICRRLDGIPLAIELAAARIRMLAPRQLAQKLDERFRILTSGDRAALPRQQTMRATIDWSYDLLSKEERAIFRSLSIFAGDFALDSAIAVCSRAGLGENAVLDALTSLVDKSLVQTESSDEQMRYLLLESTRQYARERLEEHGESDATALDHASAYLDLAEEIERLRGRMPDREWTAIAEPEIENWRTALTWSLDSREYIEIGQRLACALRRVWSSLGAPEGRRWLHTARERASKEIPPLIAAKLDLAEAQIAGALGQYKAMLVAAEAALERYETLGDALGATEAQHAAASALAFLGRVPEGEERLKAALTVARALGEQRLTGLILQSLAVARQIEGDAPAARTLFAEALVIFNAIGAERQRATVSADLAELEFHGGDAAKALTFAREALAALREQRDRRRSALQLGNIAAYLNTLGRHDEARAAAREALEAASETQGDVFVAFALQHLAAVAALRAYPDPSLQRDALVRAACLLGYVTARLETLESDREYTEQYEYDAAIASLRGTFSAEDLDKHLKDGAVWNEERAVAEASDI